MLRRSHHGKQGNRKDGKAIPMALDGEISIEKGFVIKIGGSALDLNKSTTQANDRVTKLDRVRRRDDDAMSSIAVNWRMERSSLLLELPSRSNASLHEFGCSSARVPRDLPAKIEGFCFAVTSAVDNSVCAHRPSLLRLLRCYITEGGKPLRGW